MNINIELAPAPEADPVTTDEVAAELRRILNTNYSPKVTPKDGWIKVIDDRTIGFDGCANTHRHGKLLGVLHLLTCYGVLDQSVYVATNARSTYPVTLNRVHDWGPLYRALQRLPRIENININLLG